MVLIFMYSALLKFHSCIVDLISAELHDMSVGSSPVHFTLDQ